MNLDTQTTIFMTCFVYLILHGAIWLALQEYRSFQVKLWCASGMLSGMAVVNCATNMSIGFGEYHSGLTVYARFGF